MTDLPFEQWHPDAQRQCGFWWDLSPIACGQCERCRKEQQFHAVSPLGKALADFGDKLVAAQAELPPEVAQVLREHRWNLYEGEPVTPHPTGAEQGVGPPAYDGADGGVGRPASREHPTPKGAGPVRRTGRRLRSARGRQRRYYLAPQANAWSVACGPRRPHPLTGAPSSD